MADVTIIIAHRLFIVKPRYLLYFSHNMFSAMQQIGYDLQIWCAYRLTFAKCFFRSINTCTIWKEKRIFISTVIYD